jgi:hypothetical protein
MSTLASKLARAVLEGSAGPYYVSGTETQRDRIVAQAAVVAKSYLDKLTEELAATNEKLRDVNVELADYRRFVRADTLVLQGHCHGDSELEAMFQRFYSLYARYKLDPMYDKKP